MTSLFQNSKPITKDQSIQMSTSIPIGADRAKMIPAPKSPTLLKKDLPFTDGFSGNAAVYKIPNLQKAGLWTRLSRYVTCCFRPRGLELMGIKVRIYTCLIK